MWKSLAGVHYKTNVTPLQKYEEDKSQETASNPKWTLSKDPETSQEGGTKSFNSALCVVAQVQSQPERLKDYELG